MKKNLLLLLAVAVVSAVGCAPWASVRRVPFGQSAMAHQSGRQCRLSSARSFAVVLRNLDVEAILAADPDVLVVDWFAGPNACGEMDARQVERLRARPGDARGDRIVLAWLDIGHPETVRPVFVPDGPGGSCQQSLLIPISPGADGGPSPRPDDPAWKKALCEGPDSAIARIAALGFDGVYLTGISSGIAALVPDQTAAMKLGTLFKSVVDTARGRDPDFLVVPADPVVLLGDSLLEVVSGVAFHDAIFRDGYVRQTGELVPVLDGLNVVRAAGVPVLSVEFIDDAIQESHFAAICRDLGYLCCSSVREFNHMDPMIQAGNGSGCR